jgi:tRNA(fMet)-specific endonuclease VapC
MTSLLHMLDTDIASYIIKGRLPKGEQMLARLSPNETCISAVSRAELLYGLKRLPFDHALHATVRRFLSVIRTLPWDGVAADRYADIRDRLTRAGTRIGDFDTLIAAHAIAAGATLVTNNTRHFARIGAPLVLANWLEGAPPS